MGPTNVPKANLGTPRVAHSCAYNIYTQTTCTQAREISIKLTISNFLAVIVLPLLLFTLFIGEVKLNEKYFKYS